jgi:hypothetical protein
MPAFGLTHPGDLVAVVTAAVLFRQSVLLRFCVAATTLPLAALLIRFGAVPSAAR